MANVTKPGIVGVIAFKKTGGAAANPTVNTVIGVPGIAFPSNPDNNVYPDPVNKSGFLTVDTPGKKTPSVAVQMFAKTNSFFTAVNLNDWIGSNLDANADSGEYAVDLYDGSAVAYGNSTNGHRVYDGSRCAQLQLVQRSEGGPIAVNTQWISIYGDSEKGTPTTVALPSTDPGQLTDITKVAFTGGDQIRGFDLTLMRGQRYVFYDDGTLYAIQVTSGRFGGVLQLDQSPTASSIPSTTITMQIGTGGAGVQFVMLLKRDDRIQPMTTELGNIRRVYTLYDPSAGGNPCVMSAM